MLQVGSQTLQSTLRSLIQHPALMACRASLEQRDSSGATPLHYAACYAQSAVVKALLDLGADPSAVDQAGYSPWMMVGEARCFHVEQGRVLLAKEKASEEDMRECLELLKPETFPGDLLERAESGIESFLDSLGTPVTVELLEKRLRLHESLFFNPRLAIKGAFEGRVVLRHFIDRWVHVIINLLQTEPLEGPAKVLAKYLLSATLGPDSQASCAHVHSKWRKDDNRSWYRDRLMEAVKHQLHIFATECNLLRREIDAAAGTARLAADQAAVEEPEHSAEGDENVPGLQRACLDLCQVPKDQVIIPQSWQEDPFWRTVQERQVLRYDPSWALEIHDGASCFLQLVRLGVPKDRTKKLTGKEACVVSTIAEYSTLRQVMHSQMKELFARGYITYSSLCNGPYQEKMKEVVARAQQAANLTVEMPDSVIPAKRLRRLLEKTLEAEQERRGWEWPDRPETYLRHAYSFYILDTVRMSFVCKGETLPEQVRCCMRILQEFRECSNEKDGVQLLRVKSGFASGAKGDGGYADVKMLCYADLGVHVAFDGTEIPLRIIGEIQLILEGYANVKNRMHLVYEVHRGSFDRTRRARIVAGKLFAAQLIQLLASGAVLWGLMGLLCSELAMGAGASAGASTEADPAVTEALGRCELSKYFLGPYLEGKIYEGSQYSEGGLDGLFTFDFEASDGSVSVWRYALDLRDAQHGAGEEDLCVLYHYTNRKGFLNVANEDQATAELFASLLDSRAHFGQGIYCTQHEPSVWGSRARILLNNYSNLSPLRDPADAESQRLEREWGSGNPGGHRAAFCIPVLAPRELAYNIFRRQTPDLAKRIVRDRETGAKRRVRLGEDYKGRKVNPCRDVWVLQLRSETGEVQHANAEAGDLLNLLRTRLAKLREELGDTEEETLDCMEELASRLEGRANYDEAEKLCRECFQARRDNLGETHSDTLGSMDNLARVLEAQGRYEEAEALHRQGLEASQAKLGEKHPDTLASMHNLASVLEARGHHEEAEALQRKELEISRRLSLGCRCCTTWLVPAVSGTRKPNHPPLLFSKGVSHQKA
ncbi:KLC1 [Symbiodinium sp. KB8]|nr:KLC1 [Symbiodinium sp. KB8]